MRVLVAVLLLTASMTAGAESSEWTFDDWDGPSFPVHLYVPDSGAETAPVVIVMHGASRDVERYFRDWRALGEKHGLVIVVPYFSKHRFDGSTRYNLGFVFDPDTNTMRPEPKWTFSAIEPMFDAVLERIGGQQRGYAIYGHSAGSQFVHRFMYYKPGARAHRFIAANAGWYTLPVDEFEYPYGLDGSGIENDAVAALLAKPLVILLGREDTDNNAPKLRKTPEALAQGPNRLARGLTMYRSGKRRAEQLGVPFNWKLCMVKGADHDNAKMAPVAAELLLQDVRH